MAVRKKKLSIRQGGGDSNLAKRLVYRHPSLTISVQDTRTRSVTNLRKEKELLRFASGLFSSLAFLEAEGWPIRPSPEDWVLGVDNLPRLKPTIAECSREGDVVKAHASLLYALFSGSRPPLEGKPPSLPRRHRHFALLNSWMALALKEPASNPGPGARVLLYELFKIVKDCGYEWELPPRWGVGVKWRSAFKKWPGGINFFKCTHGTAVDAALDMASGALPGTVEAGSVNLGTPDPYPYAGLEPLLAELLGSRREARAWLSAVIEKGEEEMISRLAALFRDNGNRPWVLHPAAILDSRSVEILKGAASSSSVDLSLLVCNEGKSIGEVKSIKPLWLSSVAGNWYLEHCEALLGDDLDVVLGNIEALPAGQPSWGSPLLPRLPENFTTPARPFLGNASKVEEAEKGDATGSDVSFVRLHGLEEEGRLAELYAASNALKDINSSDAAYWEGVILLHLGQPQLALEKWKGLAPSENAAGWLLINRALCHERLGEFDKVLSVLASTDSLALSEEEKSVAAMIRAQSMWIAEKKTDEALDVLSFVEKNSSRREVLARVLCHKATIQLFSNKVDEAVSLLKDAEKTLPGDATPVLHFMVRHRTALAWRKLGSLEKALHGFEDARGVLQEYGLRGLESACECECGNAQRLLCRFDEAADSYRRGMEGAESLGLHQLAEDAEFNLAICTLEGGDILGALAVLEGASRRDDPSKNALFAAIDRYWLGIAYQQLGNYPESMEQVEHGLKYIKDLPDSSVTVPLLVLRGDLLLQTGQRRKLIYLCNKLRESLRPETETDDRLAAAALLAAASLNGVEGFGEGELKRALELLPAASAHFRSMWHLLSAGYGGRDPIASLYAAWDEARKSRNPYMACRALHALSARMAFPDLSSDDREWLGGFLISNRVSGPEKELLHLLKPHPRIESPAFGERDETASMLLDLASANPFSEASLESLALNTGGEGICLIRVGSPPVWWGSLDAERRRALKAAEGSEGERSVGGGRLLGARGRDGLWCGVYKADSEPYLAAQRAYLSIWTRMVEPEAAREKSPERHIQIHPAIDRLLIAGSPAMQPVLEGLQRAASFSFPVLLTGEAGVGKEICAKALHAASNRSGRKWVTANCANLTPTLATSLLFGHKKGSFTGADRDRVGLAEAARDSTLFLDEVGELPREVQASLLRFLQDGGYLPLGEVHTRSSNARIVAATNRDLSKAVKDGLFREDLFHRLNVIHIEIPPLRRRPEDIGKLLEYFISLAAEEEGLPVPTVSPAVMGRLLSYPWPGNVRELQNTAKALLVASVGVDSLTEAHLPKRFFNPPELGREESDLASLLRLTEKRAIATALESCRGNLAATARKLGISRQSLAQKMKRHQIERNSG